jgi:hypothetical protein
MSLSWTQILRPHLHWLDMNCDIRRLGPMKVKFCTWHCLIDQKHCCRMLKQQNTIKIGCLSDWYTVIGDSYLSTFRNKLGLNPSNVNFCHSRRSHLDLPSKSCMILQYSNNSVPHGHLWYAQTRGIMHFLRRSYRQWRSWQPIFQDSTYGRPCKLDSDTIMLMSRVIQVCWDLQVHLIQILGILATSNLLLLHQYLIWIRMLTIGKWGHVESI